MNTEGLQTEVYMTTEHKRNEKKAKVSFSMVMNKVLVGALILTSAVGATAQPVHAAMSELSNVPNPTHTITQNYEVSVESAVFNVNATLRAITDMQREGLVDKQILTELATQLMQLSKAVNVSGKSASSDVVNVIKSADKILKAIEKTEENAEGVTKANAALVIVESDLGIAGVSDTETMQNKQAKSFPDVQPGAWYYDSVMKLANMGAISGYSDGNFGPNDNITNAQYVAILMRTTEKGTYTVKKGENWANSVMEAAYKKGIVKPSEITPGDYNEPITRADMAVYTERAIVSILDEGKIDTTNIDRLIPDFSKVKDTRYSEYVKSVYARGIISGDEKGNFNPSDNATRAQAAAIILRTIEKGNRRDMSKVVIPPVQDTRAATTLRWDDANRPLPKAGDTFVSKDGKKTVLTSIKVDGKEIVGYGQGLDLYSGMKTAKGAIAEGVTGDIWNGDDTYLGSPYMIDPITGEGHFRLDWVKIQKYEGELTKQVKSPKTNQMCGQWMQYDGQFKMWIWLGPM